MKTYIALFCITAVLIACIITHVDGTIAATGIALLAGLGGYAAGKSKKGG
jgi:hypothetical protein